ncbi:MAG TPA: HEAT repeat domain-containing protein [Ktedonobacterales bacterium]|nr:HEAT repeat domain-containing protein [Ktedonobacterales bacterium]
MTVEELLQDLEARHHAERVRAMIALGRRGDAETRALLAELEAGDFYQRYMALYSCFGSQNREHVLRALDDPSKIIRGLALRLLPLVCDDEQLQQALASAPAQVYLPLLWKLRQRKQQATIDAFLTRLAAQKSAWLIPLLPFGSPELVASHTEQFQQEATQAGWTRLARFHPMIALDLLQQWASTATAQDTRLTQHVNALLPRLSRAAPERSFALIQTMRQRVSLHQLHLQPLVKTYPGELAELVLTETNRIYISFSQVLDRLSVSQILALYTRHTAMIGWYYAWVPQLSPEKLLAVYQAGERSFRYKGALPKEMVAGLPRVEREREARQAITRTHMTPPERLDYAEWLPWDEALPYIEPLLHASEAATRQQALHALIQTARYQRGYLPEVLIRLRTFRTEQDALRRAILQQLADLPLGVWQQEHLSDLAEIIRHGLNDVGLSPETHRAIITLLSKLLPAHLDWCAAQLATVLRERGLPPTTGTGQTWRANISDEQARRLLATLLPVLRVWMEQEKEDNILQVARWFGTRQQAAFDSLWPVLTELLQRTRALPIAEAILKLVAAQQFRRFQTLIPALVSEDASWVRLSSVSAYLLNCRQDLLTPFLRLQPYAGRWSTGRKPFLFPITRRFISGTTRQQEIYAAALMEIINDDMQESQAVTQAIKKLALLPAISPARLIALANDERSTVRTIALFALGRLDTDEGLPTLIAALQDTRARIAIPALRSFLGKMSTDQALAIIRTIPMTRVTIAKERVRMTGALASEAAYHELVALEQGELHRDVRTVLVHALAAHVTQSATWPILEAAARSAEAETALATLPGNISPQQYYATVQGEAETVEQHILRLLLLLLNHPDSKVRQGALRSGWLPVQDQQRLLLARALELLRSPASMESQAAARAIVSICRENDGPALAQAVRNLLSDRRFLLSLTSVFSSANIQSKPRLLPVVRQMLEALAEDRLTGVIQVELAMAYLPPEELAVWFQAISQRGQLHAVALVRACDLMKNSAYRELAQLEALEVALASSPDERLRRLAFAVLEAESAKQGQWDEVHLARLQTYRADASVQVAAAAAFILPREEEGEEDGTYDDVDDDDDWDDE